MNLARLSTYVMTGAELERRQETRGQLCWALSEFAGRMVELRVDGPSAALTLAARLVLDAQRHDEPVGWIKIDAPSTLFYPPDFHDNGIDLEALAIVCMPDARAALVAADRLARCGAFGLVVLDLGDCTRLARCDALQQRLLRHAEQHGTALLSVVSAKGSKPPHSPASVRATLSRQRVGERFRCVVHAERDRQRGPGWTFEEVWDGTLGLCGCP